MPDATAAGAAGRCLLALPACRRHHAVLPVIVIAVFQLLDWLMMIGRQHARHQLGHARYSHSPFPPTSHSRKHYYSTFISPAFTPRQRHFARARRARAIR